jgi:hypothetical protein
MIRARNFTLLCLIATLGLAVIPADAGQRRGQRDGQGGARTAQPRDGARRNDGRGDRRSAPPGRVVSGRPASPAVVVMPPVVRQVGPRGGGVPAVIRGYGYGYGGYGYGSGVGRVRLPRAYYSFRPRVSVGLGLWSGFAVPFPPFGFGAASLYGYPVGAYGYPAPYPVPYAVPYAVPGAYPAPYANQLPQPGYPAQAPPGSIGVTPPTNGAFGGVSLEITPADAEVWVDGGFAGRAGDFDPASQPLTLAIGPHRIEIRAPGYLPLSFDVTVTPGYVVPFQGVLQPGP